MKNSGVFFIALFRLALVRVMETQLLPSFPCVVQISAPSIDSHSWEDQNTDRLLTSWEACFIVALLWCVKMSEESETLDSDGRNKKQEDDNNDELNSSYFYKVETFCSPKQGFRPQKQPCQLFPNRSRFLFSCFLTFSSGFQPSPLSEPERHRERMHFIATKNM